MRIRPALITSAVLACVLGGPAGAAVYKVEFDIHEDNQGGSPSSQHVSVLVDESRTGKFEAANRVPVSSGSPPYVDVGLKLECTVHPSGSKVAVRGSIELTSIRGHVSLSAIAQPIIGQRKMAFDTAVELGKPVIVDNRNRLPAAAGGMAEVAVTVTKVN